MMMMVTRAGRPAPLVTAEANNSRSELGARFDPLAILGSKPVALRAHRLGARLQYRRDVLATFQTLPAASFVVDGAAQGDDAALATASAEVKWGNGIAVAATFEGEFSETTASYAGTGTVRYQW